MKPTAEDWKMVLNDIHEILHMPPIDEPIIPTEEEIQRYAVVYDWLPALMKVQAAQWADHRVFMTQQEESIRETYRKMWLMAAFFAFGCIVFPMVLWIELAMNYWMGK